MTGQMHIARVQVDPAFFATRLDQWLPLKFENAPHIELEVAARSSDDLGVIHIRWKDCAGEEVRLPRPIWTPIPCTRVEVLTPSNEPFGVIFVRSMSSA